MATEATRRVEELELEINPFHFGLATPYACYSFACYSRLRMPYAQLFISRCLLRVRYFQIRVK